MVATSGMVRMVSRRGGVDSHAANRILGRHGSVAKRARRAAAMRRSLVIMHGWSRSDLGTSRAARGRGRVRAFGAGRFECTSTGAAAAGAWSVRARVVHRSISFDPRHVGSDTMSGSSADRARRGSPAPGTTTRPGRFARKRLNQPRNPATEGYLSADRNCCECGGSLRFDLLKIAHWRAGSCGAYRSRFLRDEARR